MSPKDDCDPELLDSMIEEIDFSSIEIAEPMSLSTEVSVADSKCKGFDPYDTASLYVNKSADQN
jgi:hypothetical protein